MSGMRKISMLVIALVVMVSSIAMRPYLPSTGICSDVHVVKRAESLRSIAAKYDMRLKDLMSLNNIPVEYFTFPGQRLCVVSLQSTRKPVILIRNTVRDASVTVLTAGYMKGATVEFYIGAQGSKIGQAIKVAEMKSEKPAVLTATLDIPVQLRGAQKLVVFARAPKASKLVLQQWFYNMTSPASGYSELATAQVTGWVYDASVSVKVFNAPPAITYQVILMDANRRQYQPFVVGTLKTGVGGTVEATFNLPKGLMGQRSIFIALQDSASGSFAYALYTNKKP
jgi:LysM repeat protein